MGDQLQVNMLGDSGQINPPADLLGEADAKAMAVGRGIMAVTEKLDEMETARQGIRGADADRLGALTDTYQRGVEWLQHGEGCVDAMAPGRLVTEHFGRLMTHLRDRVEGLRRQIVIFERNAADMAGQASAERGRVSSLEHGLATARPALQSAIDKAASSAGAAALLAATIERGRRQVSDAEAALVVARQRADQAATHAQQFQEALLLMREELRHVEFRLRNIHAEMASEAARHFDHQQKLLELQRLMRLSLERLAREIERRRKQLADAGETVPA